MRKASFNTSPAIQQFTAPSGWPRIRPNCFDLVLTNHSACNAPAANCWTPNARPATRIWERSPAATEAKYGLCAALEARLLRNYFDLTGARIVIELHSGRRRGQSGKVVWVNQLIQGLWIAAFLGIEHLDRLIQPCLIQCFD